MCCLFATLEWEEGSLSSLLKRSVSFRTLWERIVSVSMNLSENIVLYYRPVAFYSTTDADVAPRVHALYIAGKHLLQQFLTCNFIARHLQQS